MGKERVFLTQNNEGYYSTSFGNEKTENSFRLWVNKGLIGEFHGKQVITFPMKDTWIKLTSMGGLILVPQKGSTTYHINTKARARQGAEISVNFLTDGFPFKYWCNWRGGKTQGALFTTKLDQVEAMWTQLYEGLYQTWTVTYYEDGRRIGKP
jgi:hypothetical protein